VHAWYLPVKLFDPEDFDNAEQPGEDKIASPTTLQGAKKVPGPLLFRAMLFLIKIQISHEIIENCQS
jgi:hypothetical protein